MFHVAEVMIEELKLEDVTPETFDPDIDLVDEVELTAWIWRPWLWCCGMNTGSESMRMIIPN